MKQISKIYYYLDVEYKYYMYIFHTLLQKFYLNKEK